MKFQVQITETLQKVVEVDAVDEDGAEEITIDRYEQQEIVLMSEDFKDVEFEVVGCGN